MNTYQNYKFSFNNEDGRDAISAEKDIFIYAFSLENAKAKAEQFADAFGITHSQIWHKHQIEPVKENYTRSFFEALLLHKRMYGDFIMHFGFNYATEEEGHIFAIFDDGEIDFLYADLVRKLKANPSDWKFNQKDTFNEKIVQLFESVGYKTTYDGIDAGDGLFTMSRDEPLPFNLPEWCNNFIF